MFSHASPSRSSSGRRSVFGFRTVATLAGALATVATLTAAASRLPRATPEAQGVASAAILEFVTAADTSIDSMNSFMLVRGGHVVAEGWWTPYTANDPHQLYSLSKSFTSTAVGLAVAEGKLTINDPVISHFPAETPANPSDNLRAMRVRDLLTMSTGHHNESLAGWALPTDPAPVKRFLGWTVDHKPGSFFVYNSPATFMQSALVQKLTGQNLVDYLRPRLFEPLGMGTPRWEQSATGVAEGASGLFLRTEDIASFGQLYLQKGKWQGQQLIPADWIEAATAKQVSNGSSPASDWDQGYGFQFWRCRPGFYRGDGAHGQFCIVMPEQDAVVAITSGVQDMQAVMNLVWDKLVPALATHQPLPADAANANALQQKLASLTVRGPAGVATSPLAATISGRTYVLPANDRKLASITLQVADGKTSLIVRGDGYDAQPIVIGHGAWQRGGATRFGSDVDPRRRILRDEPVSAIGGWETPDTFVAKLCYHETPYQLTLRLQFGGDLVVFDGEYNVAFGNRAYPQLVGRAQ